VPVQSVNTPRGTLLVSTPAATAKPYVRKQAHESTALLPKAPQRSSSRIEDWKLYVNAKVEPDL